MPRSSLIGLRAAAAITSAAAYATLAFIGWSLVSLDQCNASEGCLLYVSYFLFGCIAALIISLIGVTILLLAHRRQMHFRTLLVSILILGSSILGVLVISWLSK